MSRGSKVTPTTVKLNPVANSTNSDKELQYLMNYVNTKAFYHPAAARNAKVVNREQKIAFQVEIWTLMEKRSTETKEKPFDEKPALGEDLGDIFDQKYSYTAPQTNLPEKKREYYDLNNTRQKLICPSCQGKGTVRCRLCNETGQKFGKPCMVCNGEGSSVCKKCSKIGSIVRWERLNIEWYTIYSVSYPRNTFLPDEHVKEAKDKDVVFDGDEKCIKESLDSTFPHLLKEITTKSPHDFAPFIDKQFCNEHFTKKNSSTRIWKIKCLIQQLDIMEIDYQSGTLQNTKNASKGTQKDSYI